MNAQHNKIFNVDTYSNNRIVWVDNLRGIAIILMVVFHFCYDLRFFGWVNWTVPNGDGWWQFRYVILSLFTFTMGISLSLAHQTQLVLKKFLIRITQLAIAASLITVMSLYMFPKAWIYFGILHFFLAASIIGIFFVKQAFAALILGLFILIVYWLEILEFIIPFYLFEEYLPGDTEDFVPLLPWLGVCLLGIAAGKYLPLKKIDDTLPNLPKALHFLGRHGLIIYLIHQPIFFAILLPLSLLH